MFVLNPDPNLLPQYRIIPFKTADLSFNYALPDSKAINQYFDFRFKEGWFTYTQNGRDAIFLALSYFKLHRDDEVSILKTTGNF